LRRSQLITTGIAASQIAREIHFTDCSCRFLESRAVRAKVIQSSD
jgi:hypothetical protein